MDKITKYWLEQSMYDLETAQAMFKTKRYLYVMFLCQQSIEKILKAIITTVSNITPPRIHDLIKLTKSANIYELMDKEQIELCTELTPFCIEARYPEYRENMSKLSTKKNANTYLVRTKGLHRWLKHKIK